MIRVGIIGAGIRGQLFARALAHRAEVVGLADSSPAAREWAVARGLPAYADHRTLLEKQRPDAVIIATPDFAHRDPAVAAARAGAHVLVEKPMATTTSDAYAIRSAVEEAGVWCMVGFENRWNPHFLRLKAAIDDGSLGRPICQSATLSNTVYVPTRMLSWATRSSPVWFLLPHLVDLACWLSGASPVSVFARGTRGLLAARGIDTWDVVHVSIAMSDGGLLDMTSAWVLPESAPRTVEARYELVGTNGSASVDLGAQGLTMATDTYQAVSPLGIDINDEPVGIPAWMAQRFVQALESGEEPTPAADQGAAVTETLVAVDQSLKQNRPVTLDGTA